MIREAMAYRRKKKGRLHLMPEGREGSSSQLVTAIASKEVYDQLLRSAVGAEMLDVKDCELR